MNPLPIDEIKARLSIPEAWKLLDLPGEPGKCCHSPFREDKHPSFSVFADGRRFHDHACGDSGSVLDFIQLALDSPLSEALAWAREKCGGENPSPRYQKSTPLGTSDAGGTTGTWRNVSEQSRRTPGYTVSLNPGRAAPNHQEKGSVKFRPRMRKARSDELAKLASLRGYALDTLKCAEACGLLAFANIWGRVAWMVCDPCGRIAEGRRLDGLPWEAYGSMPARKCHAWGGQKNWPVNLEAAAQFPKLAFVEGGPDTLAAFEIVRREGAVDSVGVVGMLGASNTRLDVRALPFFQGKQVRLFPHADEAGQRAAREWSRMLWDAGAAHVDAFDLSGIVRRDGLVGKDLCDLLNISPDCLTGNSKFCGNVMP